MSRCNQPDDIKPQAKMWCRSPFLSQRNQRIEQLVLKFPGQAGSGIPDSDMIVLRRYGEGQSHGIFFTTQ